MHTPKGLKKSYHLSVLIAFHIFVWFKIVFRNASCSAALVTSVFTTLLSTRSPHLCETRKRDNGESNLLTYKNLALKLSILSLTSKSISKPCKNYPQCTVRVQWLCGSILTLHAIPGRVSVVARRGLILLLDGGLWLLTRQFLTT